MAFNFVPVLLIRTHHLCKLRDTYYLSVVLVLRSIARDNRDQLETNHTSQYASSGLRPEIAEIRPQANRRFTRKTINYLQLLCDHFFSSKISYHFFRDTTKITFLDL